MRARFLVATPHLLTDRVGRSADAEMKPQVTAAPSSPSSACSRSASVMRRL